MPLRWCSRGVHFVARAPTSDPSCMRSKRPRASDSASVGSRGERRSVRLSTITSRASRTSVTRGPRRAWPPELREARFIEAHQAHGDEIDGQRVRAGDHRAERHVVGCKPAFTLAANDPVEDRQHRSYGCRRVEMEAASVAVVKAAVEVEAHAPGRTISPPIAAAQECVSAHARLDSAREPKDVCQSTAGEQRPGPVDRTTAQAIGEARLGELVASVGGPAQTVMRKPVLVAVDPDEVLDRERDPRLLVRLQQAGSP